MSRCQDCEEGRCECGLPEGCEDCEFTGVCTTCNGVYDFDLPPSAPGFPHLPFIVEGLHPRALRTMQRCRKQRRKLAKQAKAAKRVKPPRVPLPNLLSLRKDNPTSGSCGLCNRYHTSGTARKHADSSSVAYQRGVARFRNAEWCPQCFRPFGKNLNRPYAKIGPPPWD